MRNRPLVDTIDGQDFPRLAAINCPLCGRHHDPREIRARFDMVVSVAHCSHCRLAYQTPRPSEAASAACMNWRWSSSDAYVTASTLKQESAQAQLRLLRKEAPTAVSILDFGAGSGAFVSACVNAGLNATGVESSTSAIARGHELYGVNLVSDLPDERFDAITMWDVIEHLRQPIDILKMLRSRLQPGGAIFMETGNYENWLRLAVGDNWGLYLLDHQYYFSPYSLARISEEAGLRSFRLLNVNRSYPGISGLWRSPRQFLSNWMYTARAALSWPAHFHTNVMVVVATDGPNRSKSEP